MILPEGNRVIYRQALPASTFPGRTGQVTLHQIEVTPPGKRSVLVNLPADVHQRAAATLKDGDQIELIATAYEWDRKTKIALTDIRKIG